MTLDIASLAAATGLCFGLAAWLLARAARALAETLGGAR